MNLWREEPVEEVEPVLAESRLVLRLCAELEDLVDELLQDAEPSERSVVRISL